MKLFFILFTSIVLTGCATTVAKHNPSQLPNDQLAIVRGTENDMKITWGLSNKIFSRVAWVYDKNGNKIIDRGWDNTWGLTEVELEPGFYIFVIYCGQGNLYATPQVTATIEAKKEYIASCEKGGNTKDVSGKAKAYIHEVTSTSVKN